MLVSSPLVLLSLIATRSVSALPMTDSSEDASFPSWDGLNASTHLEVQLEKRGSGLTLPDGSFDFAAASDHVARHTIKFSQNSKAAKRAVKEKRGTTPLAIKNNRLQSRSTASAGTPLTQQGPSSWTGLVKVGTPAQEFQMYFDTGSTDMTIADSTCSTANCGSKARYTLASSSTATNTGNTRTSSFADGTTSSGFVYKDTVRSGNLQVAGQTFISATSLSSTVSGLDSDGIMGLAYTSLSSTGTTSFPFTLYAKGLANSMQLRLSNTKGLSKLIFGKGYYQQNIKGSPSWYAVNPSQNQAIRSYWQVRKSSMNVNGKRVISGSGVPFIVDSGTTYIVAPTTFATRFWAKVPGAKVYDANHWTFPCASPPTISVSFGLTSKMLSVSASNFNLGYLPEDKTRCIGAVIAQDLGLGASWVIGDSFLKSWYTIMDLEFNRIGFATPAVL